MEYQDCQHSLWFTETFSTPLQPLNGIPQNLAGSKIATPSTKFLFFGTIGKLRWPPCLWFAENFSTSCLEPLNGIQQILTGGKYSTSATKFVFFWPLVISIHACFFPRKGTQVYDCGPVGLFFLLNCVNRSDLWPCQFSICYIQKISRHWIIRAPPSKMREPYSNHFVRLSVRPSVRPSVHTSL